MSDYDKLYMREYVKNNYRRFTLSFPVDEFAKYEAAKIKYSEKYSGGGDNISWNKFILAALDYYISSSGSV